MIETYNFMHEPYEEWCGLSVANRAKQDGHKVQTHETCSHSVVLSDFFYCSRMHDDSEKLTVLVATGRDTSYCAQSPHSRREAEASTT